MTPPRMRPIDTEDATLAELVEETDARGTMLDLYMRVRPVRVLRRAFPGREGDAWAVMEGRQAIFCLSGRARVTLLSFRRYQTLCPAAFIPRALLGTKLPEELDCLTEAVILDARVPRVLTVPVDVFAFLETLSPDTLLLTSVDPLGDETVRLPARIVEALRN